MDILKDLLNYFGVERSGPREELINRLINYLYKPTILKSESASATVSKPSKASKKRKLSKKSDAPKKKRAPSGFILFSTAHRAELKAENAAASFAELAQQVSAKWKNLTADEKKVT